jgi:hypothetical protein
MVVTITGSQHLAAKLNNKGDTAGGTKEIQQALLEQ